MNQNFYLKSKYFEIFNKGIEYFSLYGMFILLVQTFRIHLK